MAENQEIELPYPKLYSSVDGMFRKKFYATEHNLYKKEYDLYVSDEHAQAICKKLARHFKFSANIYKFFGNRDSGAAYSGWRGHNARLSHNPSIGLLCHELAHLFNGQKNINHNHTKKLMKTIGKFIKYCKQHNYWNYAVDDKQKIVEAEAAKTKAEYEKRLAEVKPEPTKEELKNIKLEKVRQHLEKLRSKLKRTESLIEKWEKKERRLSNGSHCTERSK